ncbi:flagellar biosynthesis protein FlhB [Rhizobium sp. C1]|uniref:flagellar biosynthesis protein FlhB n=1 Tax=Rhizobium sp. C1 TaxID=1349799 RepID=UPI001E632F76|nr:flagellar biosynthesis protein FlhB [Rhizobium sp. C1]MCD2179006.1 flagellar biosynthesis protein FlhB [Rhizobium sp. C1]
MADDEDKDSKTEDPTEKRKQDALEEGNVPFSRELTSLASTVAIYVFIVFFATDGSIRVAGSLKDIFEQADQWRFDSSPDVISLLYRLAWNAGGLVLPALVLIMGFGVASSVLQNMPSPVLDRIAPKFSRVSIVAGIGRMFSLQTLVEFGKSLIKVIAVSIVVGFALKDEFFGSLSLMFSDPTVMFSRMVSDLRTILIVMLFATAIVGLGDFFWQRREWYENLRMTKQEIKEEFKQAQGDPAVKAKQRSFARTLLRRRMMANVPRATLIVANPTHYAVALRYAREESDAPIVVAKGQDLIALRIREIAEENNIPVFEDPPLARSMFAQVSVDSVIPPVFYKAVAELIHRVYSKQNKSRQNKRG